ncbi:MAG: VWA domain-containing protein [Gammaproteobacteria bacterium]|nr:VWA domain-containing protein [Gammaproteobacteria bacterium]
MLGVALLTACAGSHNKERELQDKNARIDSVAALAEVVDTGDREVRTRSDRDEKSERNQADEKRPHISRVTDPASGGTNALAIGRSPGAAAIAKQSHCCPLAPTEALDRENYAVYKSNPVKLSSEHPVSTFSVDVDTGSYSNVRRFLNAGQLPPQNAVRVEELINYFSYDYPVPHSVDDPFNVVSKLARTPWNKDTLLLQIGLKGYEVANADRKASNLVFLVDVSGSMRSPTKLPLLKDALKTLARHLDERDTVAIAGYAGGAGVILEPTNGADSQRIIDSLDNLSAAGSTNGAAGIHLAYKLAQKSFISGGINRVILATDGDFNVGTVNFEALVDLVEEKRRAGVALTALGFGSGNYNDKLLEQVADAGNGNYAYIDNQREARKVLVEEMTSTLQTIASDVKIQVEFNPATVAEYRLIGYENRLLLREDFNNDQVDAGEIGAGHTVTALYEITPVGSPAQLNDPLRYGPPAASNSQSAAELALIRLRYKLPGADHSQLVEHTVRRQQLARMDSEFRFAAAVSAFGQRLRGGQYLNNFDLGRIADLADESLGRDKNGYREEFVTLVNEARTLTAAMAQTDGEDYPFHVAN